MQEDGEQGKPEAKEALNFSRLQEEHAKVRRFLAILHVLAMLLTILHEVLAMPCSVHFICRPFD